jgi:hypothetical protein
MNLRNLRGIVYLPFPRPGASLPWVGRDRLPQTAGLVLHSHVMQINWRNKD